MEEEGFVSTVLENILGKSYRKGRTHSRTEIEEEYCYFFFFFLF